MLNTSIVVFKVFVAHFGSRQFIRLSLAGERL